MSLREGQLLDARSQGNSSYQPKAQAQESSLPALNFSLRLACIATASAHSVDDWDGYQSPLKSKAKMPYHFQTGIFRQKQRNMNERLFVWMKGLAKEPVFLWMKQGLAASARQSPGSSSRSQWAAAAMTHSTKACSIVEGSISIKDGIFHPTAMGWGGWRRRRKRRKPVWLQRGQEKGTTIWRERKN